MLKIGIAGFGKIGRVRALEISKNSNTILKAVYDIKKPIDLDNSIIFCSSFDEILNQDIDAIFICTFNNVLAEYTTKALKKGIHVFCEKPPARTSQELLSVIETEKNSNLILKYGFNHRYHYSVMEAKKIIDSGSMGKLLWLRGVYGKAGSIDYDKNWRNYREYSGGGILIDQGIHMLDLMRYFSGQDFKHINSFITTSYWKIEAEDNAFAIMQSDEKITAMLHSSATQWKHKFLLEMCFEEGYINLDGILSGTRSYAPEKLIIGRREFEDITFAMGKPKETITWFEYDDSWKLEVDEFVNAILGLSTIENGTSKDAFETLKLVERIYENSGFYSDK
ncbi:Gfo/Idh/MocA family protein [Aliarcobacter butzleri]|uniref:Gfo/Idh/MocA family protein n=1 Tax=Aliarcobacter butzleri TaxID=28197 RepID=UPI0021B35799|nr:Gfo/Idh/MocA family oxidoreductase [Aliarcobacter butzleri]MCT7584801.1 Gfo/Idh/MocA family oxidoreductase [Aliarcobacter butzleri]